MWKVCCTVAHTVESASPCWAAAKQNSDAGGTSGVAGAPAGALRRTLGIHGVHPGARACIFLHRECTPDLERDQDAWLLACCVRRARCRPPPPPHLLSAATPVNLSLMAEEVATLCWKTLDHGYTTKVSQHNLSDRRGVCAVGGRAVVLTGRTFLWPSRGSVAMFRSGHLMPRNDPCLVTSPPRELEAQAGGGAKQAGTSPPHTESRKGCGTR